MLLVRTFVSTAVPYEPISSFSCSAVGSDINARFLIKDQDITAEALKNEDLYTYLLVLHMFIPAARPPRAQD